MNDIVTSHAHDPRTLAWPRLREQLDGLKAHVVAADRALRRGTAPTTLEAQTRAAFAEFVAATHGWLGSDSPIDPDTRDDLGERLRAELLPLLLLSRNAERWYDKPRGYAGDYFTIEMIYRDAPEGVGAMGQLLDRCFLDLSAARAVRNRRPLLAREIAGTVEEAMDRPADRLARITSLACGPARELFDVFETIEDPKEVAATLVDIDFRALAHVADERDRRGLRRQMRLVNDNLVHLAKGRRHLDLEPQDLIYSIGLIDYFRDDLVLCLIDWIHDHLRDGGRVLLGNFHPRNPSRAIMDHVLEWKLIHRTEEDMHALFRASKFGRGATRILYEEEGINLFAECRR